MKRLYLEAILNERINVLTNEELSIKICSQVQLSWEQLACVIGQIKLLARPCMYAVILLYRSAKVKEVKEPLKMLSSSISEYARGACPRQPDPLVLAYYV